MKIKENRSFKSKDLLHAQFLSKKGESFLIWWKTTKSLQKYLVREKMWNIWAFLGNKLKGWSHKLETLHEDNVGPILKKAKNNKFVAAALHCEFHVRKIQIFPKYLPTLRWQKNIGIQFSRALFNWSYQSYSHPFCSLFEL